jgi:hypothetical protein
MGTKLTKLQCSYINFEKKRFCNEILQVTRLTYIYVDDLNIHCCSRLFGQLRIQFVWSLNL